MTPHEPGPTYYKMLMARTRRHGRSDRPHRQRVRGALCPDALVGAWVVSVLIPSDLTDAQWEIIEPMLRLIKEPGRISKHPFLDIVDAILYLDRSGCSWRQVPVDFSPWQTVYGWFRQWKVRGVTVRIIEECASRSASMKAARWTHRPGSSTRRI